MDKRMSQALWREWQEFVRTMGLSGDQLHVVIVVLRTRGITKSKIMLSEFATPCEIIHALLQQRLNHAVRNFDKGVNEFLSSILSIHMKFNLCQFAGGGNTPKNIRVVEECGAIEGADSLKFGTIAELARR